MAKRSRIGRELASVEAQIADLQAQVAELERYRAKLQLLSGRSAEVPAKPAKPKRKVAREPLVTDGSLSIG